MKKFSILILSIFFLSNCGSSKLKKVNRDEIKSIFGSKVYLMLSIGKSNNDYHNHLYMFKDNKENPFFPIYTSKKKILETEMVMPDDAPFDGILLALTSFDNMTYKINYSLEDEIVIKGSELKKILENEIEEFKKNNPEIMEGIILKN
ncbi:hypothetical protein [Aquimarina sediminis]|uniref:hypothetical protein n=1 Tax=Aquimarina sediminis TaxID=2070536 RepID=UPI000CA036DF|nr:hypothetical protein [Aquimarina sediminis]